MAEETQPTTMTEDAEEVKGELLIVEDKTHHRHSLVLLCPVSGRRVYAWDSLKREVLLAVPELEDVGSADLIKAVFTAGIRDVQILKSIAALALPNSVEATTNYNHHILTLATFLALSRRNGAKLACVRTLMTLRSPLEAGWQLQETVVKDTLRFITDRDYEWEYLDHSDEVLLWELRAICLQQIEMRRDKIIDCVTNGGNAAANFLSKQAIRVERGLEVSTDVVNAAIEGGAECLKQKLQPGEKPLFESNSRAKVVTLTYSDSAKRATDSVRETSRQAMMKVQTTSTNGIDRIASQMQERGVGERLVPNEKSRKVVCAVGRFGTAALGATAIVADALLESTGQVAKKTSHVTADIIGHKYGSSAGQLVRNSSDTVGNILRTVGHVTLLHRGQSMTRSVAKKTGKMHVLYMNETSLVSSEIDEAPSSDDDADELFVEPEGADVFNGGVVVCVSTPEGESQAVSEMMVSTTVETCFDSDNAAKNTEGQEPRIETDPHAPIGAESFIDQQFSCVERSSDVFLVDEDHMSEFDTTLTLSPSALDALPDMITSVDPQSDFFSDITNEPLYERSRGYSDLFHRKGSSTSSIFRNVEDEPTGYVSFSSMAKDGDQADGGTPIKCSFDDDSSDCTARTVDETYLTNSSLLIHDEETPHNLLNSAQCTEEMLNSEHHKTLDRVKQECLVSSASPGYNPASSQGECAGNRIPPNGYLPSTYASIKKESWPKGLYSSVRSNLGLNR